MKSEVPAHKAHLRLAPNRSAVVVRQHRMKNECEKKKMKNIEIQTQIKTRSANCWHAVYFGLRCIHTQRQREGRCERAHDLSYLREILLTRLMLEMHEI